MYINTLFATKLTHQPNKAQVSMRRSDGELFSANINLLTEEQADKIVTLFNYFEELRTCSCSLTEVCSKHSGIRKV